jgi:hypothetical protein
MNPIIGLEVAGVLVCWVVVAYAIWKWGPGLRMRSVRCPERKMRARVLAEQREAEFGSLRTADVQVCSLFPGAPLSCGKACIARL